MDQTIIMCHKGKPCDPPIINMPHGDPILFEASPDGGDLWIAACTPEQVEDMKPFPFFFPMVEDTSVPKIEKDIIPDASWTRAGIAEWAQRELNVTLDMKLPAEMLADLQAAIAKAEQEKAALPPFVAEDAQAEKPEPPLVIS